MVKRDAFLQLIWDSIIDADNSGEWIDVQLAQVKKPRGPFSDIPPIVKRLLDLGASREDLTRLMRYAYYTAVFNLIVLLEYPGLDGDPQTLMLHEDLLSADPTGAEGGAGPLRAPPEGRFDMEA